MPRVLLADNDFPDIAIERDLFGRHGVDLEVARCRTEDDVIRAAQGACGILVQYAPITERVVASLPALGIVSRIGAGYDTIDTKACAKHGVWVANSPDYGVGEVATHALAMALAMVRNIVARHRDVTGGRWHYTSAGPVRRAGRRRRGAGRARPRDACRAGSRRPAGRTGPGRVAARRAPACYPDPALGVLLGGVGEGVAPQGSAERRDVARDRPYGIRRDGRHAEAVAATARAAARGARCTTRTGGRGGIPWP
jgi:hypothetical protein